MGDTPTTLDGVIRRAVRVYYELGASEKIKSIIESLSPTGLINDVPPEKYGELYEKLEALRGG